MTGWQPHGPLGAGSFRVFRRVLYFLGPEYLAMRAVTTDLGPRNHDVETEVRFDLPP